MPTDEWQLTKIIETFLEELEARERANVHKNKSEFYPKRSRESPTMKTFSSTGNVGCWSRRASAWAARAMYFGCHSVCLSSRDSL